MNINNRELSLNPFNFHPTYIALKHLPGKKTPLF
jgi:hypothetical protein